MGKIVFYAIVKFSPHAISLFCYISYGDMVIVI